MQHPRKQTATTLQYRSSHSTSRAGWCAASLTSAAAIRLTDDAQGLRSDSLPVTRLAAMPVGALGNLAEKRRLVNLQSISADEALTEYPATARCVRRGILVGEVGSLRAAQKAEWR